MSACICGDNRIKRLTLLYKSNGERERRRSDGEESKRRKSKKNAGKGLKELSRLKF